MPLNPMYALHFRYAIIALLHFMGSEPKILTKSTYNEKTF